MSKDTTVIVLGTAHRMREPGKQSPDGQIKECIYSRSICIEIAEKLRAMGYKVDVDYSHSTFQSPCRLLLSSWRGTGSLP